MSTYFRRRSSFHLPITLSVSLMALNVTLMICWIILLAQRSSWGVLAVGVVAFTLILVGLSIWLALTIKEISLNNRQANFVDSVTHELKSPIASLQLYLETIRMRHLSDAKRDEFHAIMQTELQRLDKLINQLLEVGRLDAIGENEEPMEIAMGPMLEHHAETACAQRKFSKNNVFKFDMQPEIVEGRKIVLDLIFLNLLDNAVKYGGEPPIVDVSVEPSGKSRLLIKISSNGGRIPHEDRKKIFQIFYRGGSELERRCKGTGLGLYIVHTLVRKLRGRISVHDRDDGGPGCTFEVEIPGRISKLSEKQES